MTTTSSAPANAMLSWSAGQIIERIAAGEVSAGEVTEAFLRRIEQVNPLVNAIVFPMFEQARAAAAAVDAARKRGEALGPLAGLPMTVKESFNLAGTPTTAGLVTRASHRAKADAFHVGRLRGAGAVVLGKTNVPQLLLCNDSQNPLYGRTKNPWNPERSAGGSSGGEAAAIAAGCSPLGLGSDIGGSLRLPANACGICSLKPTSGRLTMAGHFDPLPGQAAILAQPGPMARYVRDLDLMFRFLCTPEQSAVDSSIPPVPFVTEGAAAEKPLRVGFYVNNGVMGVAPAVARAVREAAAALGERGVQVVEWQPPEMDQAWELYLGLLMANGSSYLRRLSAGNKKERFLRLTILAGRWPNWYLAGLISPLFHAAGQHHLGRAVRCLGRRSTRNYWRLTFERDRYRGKFLAAMTERGCDALLCPVDALPAMQPGRGGDLSNAVSYAALYNLLGMPAGAVPVTRVRTDEESERPSSFDRVERIARATERGSAGLPIGVQIVARHWREDVVLRLMQMVEEHFAQRPDYPAAAAALPVLPTGRPEGLLGTA